MLWGNSPPVNLISQLEKSKDTIDILIVGGCDARHIIKTLSNLYRNNFKMKIIFHSLEASLEDIARSILLINICLEKDLGLQESSRYFLEILGNTLIIPATAKYVIGAIRRLIDVITQSYSCSWLDLEGLKYRDRDGIEAIFKFWIRALCEGVPIVSYWDKRIRNCLKARYDYRDGVFDWDYHMVLKSMGLKYLSIEEYKFWRNNGIAFTWLETEPSRSNPTLLSDINAVGQGFIHFAYKGDIKNGPFFTWSLDDLEKNEKLRATDVAEGQVLKAIYQIRKKEECPDEFIAAHRSKSLLGARLVTQMPDCQAEYESWEYKDYRKRMEDEAPWIDLENVTIKFHPAWYIEKFKNKSDLIEKFDIAFIANNITNQTPTIAQWVKKDGIVLIEGRKFMTELRKEDHDKFFDDLKKLTEESGLKPVDPCENTLENITKYTKSV